jgi:hypothetical protein
MLLLLLLLLLLLQVWENTPGFGEAPFLDTLWSAIDEVRMQQHSSSREQQQQQQQQWRG